MLEQGRTVVPVEMLRTHHNVVAEQRAHRNRCRRPSVESIAEGLVVTDDLDEPVLRPLDEVHLVDREHDVLHPEQVGDQSVTAGLGQDAVSRVDQEHRDISGRSGGHHVPRVLLMARRVGDHQSTARRGHEPVGDIDRDALLALRCEAIGEQGEIEAAGGARNSRVPLECRELILVDLMRLVEQSPEQGALAVVDTPAGHEAQLVEVGHH